MRRPLLFVSGGVAVVVAVGAAVLFWPSPRRQTLDRVQAIGGTYREDDDGTGRKLCIVGLINQPAADDDLAVLRHIRPLHRVLLDGSKVTDAGLAHLKDVEGLEWVSVCGTRVTDAGMEHLAAIPSLRSIHLRKTQVSDAGLVRLHGMPHLEFLNVAESRVTADGVTAMKAATPSLTWVYHEIPDDD